MSEWLRRWTRNPLGSARRGSNPLGVVLPSFLAAAPRRRQQAAHHRRTAPVLPSVLVHKRLGLRAQSAGPHVSHGASLAGLSAGTCGQARRWTSHQLQLKTTLQTKAAQGHGKSCPYHGRRRTDLHHCPPGEFKRAFAEAIALDASLGAILPLKNPIAKTLWPSGLRRQTQVLVERSAWVRTPQVSFFALFCARHGATLLPSAPCIPAAHARIGRGAHIAARAYA